MKSFRVFLILGLLSVLVLGAFVLKVTYQEMGDLFPGYLAYENGVKGIFYLPGWQGPKVFDVQDYVLIVLFPVISGIFFVFLGALASYFLPSPQARFPCFLFHFLVGAYLVMSPEFHLTHRLSYVHLAAFALIPAAMIHFAFLFPQGKVLKPKARLIGYILSVIGWIPYTFYFERQVSIWAFWESLFVLYVVATYLFWMGRMGATFRKPQEAHERIIARTLLIGQIVGFALPLLGAALIFAAQIPFPLNLATPVTLLFPIALLVGVVLGRLDLSRIELVRSEKRAAFGALLGGLAHELKNPLTFIYSNLEPLEENVTALEKGTDLKALGEIKTIAREMEEGVTRALKLVENFRIFSRPGSQKKEPVDLKGILADALHFLSPHWKGRLQIEIQGESTPVWGDPMEFSQAFSNILMNGFQAMGFQGVFQVLFSREGQMARIIFSDRGVGLSEEELLKIFDPFYTTKPPDKGTGLGLAITREIIEKQGGSIEMKSEKGKGTDVIVHLPVS